MDGRWRVNLGSVKSRPQGGGRQSPLVLIFTFVSTNIHSTEKVLIYKVAPQIFVLSRKFYGSLIQSLEVVDVHMDLA